jgi:hypothetical protein
MNDLVRSRRLIRERQEHDHATALALERAAYKMGCAIEAISRPRTKPNDQADH